MDIIKKKYLFNRRLLIEIIFSIIFFFFSYEFLGFPEEYDKILLKFLFLFLVLHLFLYGYAVYRDYQKWIKN